MHIVHTVSAIAEEASGPSYSVVRLCEALRVQRQEVTLPAPPPFLKAFPLGLGPRRLGWSPVMKR